MAILQPDLLARVRNSVEHEHLGIHYTKAEVNAAAQAIEDYFESSRSAFNTQINLATAPLVLDDDVKRQLIRYTLIEKFQEDLL